MSENAFKSSFVCGHKRLATDVNDGNLSEFIDEMKQANITVYHIHVGTDQAPTSVMELANNTGAAEPPEAPSQVVPDKTPEPKPDVVVSTDATISDVGIFVANPDEGLPPSPRP